MSKRKKKLAKVQKYRECYGARTYQYKPRHSPLRSRRKYHFNWNIATKGPNGKYQSGITRFKLECAKLDKVLNKRDDYIDSVPVNYIHALDARRYPACEYMGIPHDSDLSPREYFKKYYLCNPEVRLETKLNLQKELHKFKVKCTLDTVNNEYYFS